MGIVKNFCIYTRSANTVMVDLEERKEARDTQEVKTPKEARIPNA